MPLPDSSSYHFYGHTCCLVIATQVNSIPLMSKQLHKMNTPKCYTTRTFSSSDL